jgi:hypothetical protein
MCLTSTTAVGQFDAVSWQAFTPTMMSAISGRTSAGLMHSGCHRTGEDLGPEEAMGLGEISNSVRSVCSSKQNTDNQVLSC